MFITQTHNFRGEAKRHQVKQRDARHQRGFSLIELSIAMVMFGILLVLFGATFPVATRAGHVGSDYAQATLLAQQKVDQLRRGGYGGLFPGSLSTPGSLAYNHIIDTDSNGNPITVTTPAGFPAGSVSFTFTLVDNLVDNTKNSTLYKGFYPASSTGVLTIGPAQVANGGTNLTLPGQSVMKMATVTVTWTGGNQSSGSFTTHTIIGSP